MPQEFRYFMTVLCFIGMCKGSSVEGQAMNASSESLPNPIIDNRICGMNSSDSLSFVTSLSIRGCPVFVHRVGAVKAGRFVLEPTFCITEPSALRSPSAHFDLLTNEFYFSFPVNVTDEDLATEVASSLRHLSPKSVSFLEVTSVRLSSERSLAFTNATFLWGPTESVGHLRLICSGFECQLLKLYLAKGQTEVFQKTRLTASMRVGEGCASVERQFPVTVARSPFLPIKSMQRPWTTPMRSCSDLQLFKVVQLDNCTAYVHQRRSKTGDFVIEPLLCPSPSFQLLRDFSLGSHYVRLPAVVEHDSVIAAVRSQMGSVSIKSISFMKLWDASIHVTSRLSQWRFEPLRLSVDRRSAELRAYCNRQASCESLGFVLKTEPVNFWKNIQWTAISLLDEDCEFRTEHRRFALRMKDRLATGTVLVQQRTGGRWTSEDLRNRTVTRDGSTFIVIAQRGCRASNFQRTWKEYVAGFGDKHSFWIGLDIIHSLTSWQGTTMRVEMLLWNDTEWYAMYSGFTVGNASTNYLMTFSEMIQAKSSLVVNSLSTGYFSTVDVDNDGYSSHHCSRTHGGNGGWWYPSGCGNSFPNSPYHYGQTTSTVYSSWYFREGYRSLKEFRMMVQI